MLLVYTIHLSRNWTCLFFYCDCDHVYCDIFVILCAVVNLLFIHIWSNLHPININPLFESACWSVINTDCICVASISYFWSSFPGYSLLHAAASYGNLVIMRLLLDNGYSVDGRYNISSVDMLAPINITGVESFWNPEQTGTLHSPLMSLQTAMTSATCRKQWNSS